MSKPARRSISAALRAASDGRKPEAAVEQSSPASHVGSEEPTKAVEAPKTERPAKKKPKPSKAKTVHLGGYFDEAVHKQFKLLAVEEDKTIQELMREAINMVFTKYRKPPIA